MTEFDKEMKHGLIAYAVLVVIVVVLVVAVYDYALNQPTQSCTCRYHQHGVHYGNTYNKVNRKCIDLGNGSVQVGDTVYTGVTWYRNECE